ncbi:right-handed parallel beta-helix repeat-containing protein [Bacillus weihaiensis]|uniref:Right handed beta helix domain-containing protein n=1 Tax=Bacillus weihaiensis TaxID=1547283 RepID=A0A1L3MRM2_9BACI|nr:right-handed parallel beta-helix repeat-containing protein [Bacillus weihaiensis]APH04967.1 hypothetical protein A9C19_09515 [Bacillus weihaiensis]
MEDVTVEHFQTMGVRIQNSHDVVVTDSSIVFNKKLNLILCLVLVFHLLPVVSTVSANEATKLDIKSVDDSSDEDEKEELIDPVEKEDSSNQDEKKLGQTVQVYPNKTVSLENTAVKIALPQGGDVDNDTITLEVNHFSTYGVFAKVGTTLGMEVFDIEDTEGQYVRIVGYGNGQWISYNLGTPQKVGYLGIAFSKGDSFVKEQKDNIVSFRIKGIEDDEGADFALVPPKEEEREDVTYTEPGLINPDGSVEDLPQGTKLTIEKKNLSNTSAQAIVLESREGTVLVSSFSNEPNGKVMRAFGQSSGGYHIQATGVEDDSWEETTVTFANSATKASGGYHIKAQGLSDDTWSENTVHDIHISDLTVTSSFDGEFSTNHSENNNHDDLPAILDAIEAASVGDEVYLPDGGADYASKEHSENKPAKLVLYTKAKSERSGYQNDTRYNVVKDSVFEGPYIRHGVLLQFYAHNNLIINNTLTNTVLDAIDNSADNFWGVSFEYDNGDSNANNVGSGLHGEDEYLNVIEENTISGVTKGAGIATNSREGIKIHMGSPDTLIEGNVISDTKPSNISLSGNTITGNTNGVRILDGENTFANHPQEGGVDSEAVFVDTDSAYVEPVEPPADAEIVEIEVIEDALIRDGQYLTIDDTNTIRNNTGQDLVDNRITEPNLFKFDKSQVGEEIVAAKLQVYNLSLEAGENYSNETKLKVKERGPGNDYRRQSIPELDGQEFTAVEDALIRDGAYASENLGNTGGSAPSNHDNSGPGNVILNNHITNPDNSKGILLMNAPGTVVKNNTIQNISALQAAIDGLEEVQDSDDQNKDVITASGHDGNFPENTLDDNLETRWSAQGELFRKATDVGGGGAGYGVSIQGTAKTDEESNDPVQKEKSTNQDHVLPATATNVLDVTDFVLSQTDDTLSFRLVGIEDNQYGNADKLKIKERAAGNDYRRQAIVKFGYDANAYNSDEVAIYYFNETNKEWEFPDASGPEYGIYIADGLGAVPSYNITIAPEGSVQSDEVFVGQDDSYILIDVTQRQSSFSIEMSNDGEAWKEVYSQSQSSNTAELTGDVEQAVLKLYNLNLETKTASKEHESMKAPMLVVSTSNEEPEPTIDYTYLLIGLALMVIGGTTVLFTRRKGMIYNLNSTLSNDGASHFNLKTGVNIRGVTELLDLIASAKAITNKDGTYTHASFHQLHSPNPVTGTVHNVLDFGADSQDNAGDEYTFTFDFPAGMESYTGTYLLTLSSNDWNSVTVVQIYAPLDDGSTPLYEQENPEEPEDSSDPGDKETPNDSDKQEKIEEALIDAIVTAEAAQELIETENELQLA